MLVSAPMKNLNPYHMCYTELNCELSTIHGRPGSDCSFQWTIYYSS